MAWPSGAAAEVKRWCACKGAREAGEAIGLWILYSWQAIAYSRLALASPAAGLVAASVGACCYALRGAGRPIAIAPTGAICAIAGSSLASLPRANAAGSLVALALLTSGLLLLARALRVTFSERLFPEPVRVGFLAGTGVTVMVAESADLALNGPASLAVGVGSLASMLMLRRLGLRASAPLVVLALATAASAAFDLQGRGVRVVGSAGVVLAPAPLSLLLDERMLTRLVPAALGIAVLASVHSLVPPEAGLSTLGARVGPGARRAAALASALSVLSLALSDVLAQLPLAAISAVLLVVCLGWIDARRLSELRRQSPRAFRMALSAAFGVTIFGPLAGLAIGIAAALREMLRQADAGVVSAAQRVRIALRADAVPLNPGARWRRRERYRWVSATWPPRRQAARRSPARDHPSDAAGIKPRALR